jgi:hypothetical protein
MQKTSIRDRQRLSFRGSKAMLKTMKIGMIWMLLTMMAAAAGPTMASNLDTAARDHLNAMANSTEPSIHYGSNNTYVGLGSFSLRVPNNRAGNMFSATAPRINSSCNGWDIFAGSFAIMSADRIMQTLRSMASAIPMVAFRMAMAWLSQQLESITGDLFEQLMNFNKDFQAGCELQETLMEGFDPKAMNAAEVLGEAGGRLGSRLRAMGESFRAVFEQTEDAAEGKKEPGVETEGAVNAVINDDERFIHRNWIWETLKGANVVNGSGATPDALARDLISMTGYVQQCIKSDTDKCLTREELEALDSDRKKKARIEWETAPAELSYRDFVMGQKAEDGTLERNLNVLVCKDVREPFPCITMEKRLRTPSERVDGMVKIMSDLFLGPTNAPGDGIIGRSALPNSEPTPYELRVLAASGAFGKLLMEVRKKSGEGTARLMFENNKVAIANEISYGLLRGMLRELETNISRAGQTESIVNARLAVVNTLAKVNDDYEAIQEQEKTQNAIDQLIYTARGQNPAAGGM